MKISTKGRYGTRAMVDIGERHGQGPVSLKELAQRQCVSMKYMEQIIPLLKAAGLVRSTRGAKGGYGLARSPGEISLKEIVQALEGPLTLVECLADEAYCPRSEECVTYDVWHHIQESLHRVLQEITLEDMIVRHKRKKKKRAAVSCPIA